MSVFFRRRGESPVKIITAIPSQSGSLTYTGDVLTPGWSNYNSAQLAISGETSATTAGTHYATFTPTANYRWSDGTTTGKEVAWTIGKAAGHLSLSKTSITLNSSTKSTTFTVSRAGDGAISAVSSDTSVATVSVSGTTVTVNSVNNKTGTATITVSVAAGTNFTAPSNKTCSVTAIFNPIAVTITGTGQVGYCYAIINGTKQYRAGTHEVYAGDTITFGVYGSSSSAYGSVTIDGTQVLRVADRTKKTYHWTVPDGISTVEILMIYQNKPVYGRIIVTTS